MPRKARAEVERGLYEVVTRGNNRRQIFGPASDYQKFLALLAAQKIKLPFFLYTYSLMSNHCAPADPAAGECGWSDHASSPDPRAILQSPIPAVGRMSPFIEISLRVLNRAPLSPI